MRRYLKILVCIAVLFILGIAFFAVYTRHSYGDTSLKEGQIILLNDVASTAADNWGDLSVLDSVDATTDFVITNEAGQILYASGEADAEELSSGTAIKNHYPYQYVVKDGRVIGTAILLDNGNSLYESLRLKMIVGAAILALIILGGAAAVGVYVNDNITKPFRRMESFARNVAEGNLDEPLKMDRDNLFGAFTESFDIMREELRDSRARELELQKKERELIASLSHDLKTPITGIKLTTELLKAKHEMNPSPASEAELQKLNNIYDKADEIDVLVNDLFSATLNDLGEFTVNCKDEESTVIEQIVKRYDDKSLVTAGEIPNVIINVDVKRLSQVIGNIITNSYKYAGTKIDVSYELIDGFLQMRIRDYGPGVPEDELSLIANKFYRGKTWRESNQNGNGLGLYIANTLMQKMNGELIPESRGGFIVTLLIPLS